MLRSILLFLILTLFISCAPEPKELTQQDIAKEKNDVIAIMKAYNKANEEENFSKIIDLIAKDIIFFGTDSAEVIKDIPTFKNALLRQWEVFDTKYGEMTEIDIQMDKSATFASLIFGIPCDIKIKDKTFHLYLRMARTFKKESSKWVIVSGVVSMVESEQALALTEYMKKNSTAPGK